MDLFLSYRRDDTGGRAGRLFDALVARYGPSHVFHDVNTVEPGLNFVRQVESAVKRSDAVLVVIGPSWLSSTAPDGSRRIDRSDDFVRREVGMALEADVRVVPVLVDGASLPPASEMPDDLVPLLERHAVSIRDTSWQRDVDDLIRRLEGEPQPSEPGKSRRRLVVGGLVGAAAIAAGAVAFATRGGDAGDSSEWVEPPPCQTPSESWGTVPLVDDPTAEITISQHTVLLGVQRLALRPASDGTTLVVVDVEVRNVTSASEPVDPEHDFYYTWAEFDGLYIDGVGHLEVACTDSFGNPNLRVGDAIRGRIGYETSYETADALFQLRMDQGSVTINER